MCNIDYEFMPPKKICFYCKFLCHVAVLINLETDVNLTSTDIPNDVMSHV